MSWFLRRLRQTLLILALLIAVAVVVGLLLGPKLVERETLAALRARGLTDATLEVQSVGWRHTHVSHLSLGEGLSAEAVQLTYSPGTLLSGRARAVTVIGAEWHVAINEDGLDLGPIERWRGGNGGSGDVPLTQFRLRASTLVLDINGQPHRLPVAGTVTRRNPGKAGPWHVELTTHYAGRRWRITGTCPRDARRAELTLHMGERVLAEVNYHRRGNEHQLAVTGELEPLNRQLLGKRFVFEGGHFSGAITLDTADSSFAGNLAVRGASLSIGERTLTRPVVAVTAPDRNGATWQLQVNGQSKALANGSLGWSDGALRLDTRPIDLTEADPLAGLLKAVTGAAVTGTAGLDGRLAWRGGRLRPRLTVTLEQATIALPGQPYRVAGLEAAVTFDQFSPLATPGGQRVRWKDASLGKLAIGEGAARFTVESPGSLLIEHLTWRMWGGRMRAMGVRLDPAAPAFSANLFAEDVALGPWLDTWTAGYVQGSGRLTGRLALRVKTEPRLRLAVGNSFLQAVGPGELSISASGMVERMLAKYAASGTQRGAGELVRARIAASLKQFRYRTLRFTVQTQRQPPVLRVTLAGEGGEHDQGLNLTVNFTDFPAFLDAVLRFNLGMKRAGDPAFNKPTDAEGG